MNPCSVFSDFLRGCLPWILLGASGLLWAEPPALPALSAPSASLAAAAVVAPDEAQAQIDVLRARARDLRATAEQRFRSMSAACADRFFVNACIDGARSTRLEGVTSARALEAEAGAIERRLRSAVEAENRVRREVRSRERERLMAAPALPAEPRGAAGEAILERGARVGGE